LKADITNASKKIVSLTSVLTCQVSCGHVVLKGLMLNMPPVGAAL